MKTVLFCMNPYSFGILQPIMEVLKEKNSIDQIADLFINKRYEEKKIIAEKSFLIGNILNSKNTIGFLRDIALKSIGKQILEDILNP